jgi:hypothetical protein
VLVTRAKMLGYGMNLQMCGAMVFSGFNDSFEDVFQAVHRAVRHGQTKAVRVYFPVVRELEGDTLDNLDRKRAEYAASVARRWRTTTSSGTAGKHYIASPAFFVCCRQSLAGRMESFAPLSRTRTRRGMNEQASAWLNAVEGLPAVHARLKRVVVLNRDALDVIRQQDGPDTLYYLDPPYEPGTRAAADVYAHEMSQEGHHNLLTLIRRVKGMVLLSGYRSAMYDDLLGEWHRVDFDLPNNSAGGKAKRRMVEVVWMNFKPKAEESNDRVEYSSLPLEVQVRQRGRRPSCSECKSTAVGEPVPTWRRDRIYGSDCIAGMA